MASIVSPASQETKSQSETATDSQLGTLTGVQILGTGAYAPAEIVRNEDLADLGYDAEWILQRTGIRQRRRAGQGMATSDMAYQAARAYLDEAGLTQPKST